VLDLAPHGLDLAEFFTGEPVEQLSMVLQRRVHDYPVEDGGITGRTPSGVLFSSHTSYNWPETLPRRRLEIAGTGGIIVASNTMGQDAGGHMTSDPGGGWRARGASFDTDTTPFSRQAAAFHAMLRGEPHPFDIDRDIAAAHASSTLTRRRSDAFEPLRLRQLRFLAAAFRSARLPGLHRCAQRPAGGRLALSARSRGRCDA
jgi:predicted dehydrogenase